MSGLEKGGQSFVGGEADNGLKLIPRNKSLAADLCSHLVSAMMSLRVSVRQCVLCGNITRNEVIGAEDGLCGSGERDLSGRSGSVDPLPRQQCVSLCNAMHGDAVASFLLLLFSPFMILPRPLTHEY